MEKEQIKQELINRYKYIYENAVYILAPYMYEETKEERDRLNEEFRKENKNHPCISNDLLIYLKELPVELLLDLESFLLSDISFNQSKLYTELEEKKKNPEFLTVVKKGLDLVEKHNIAYSIPILLIKLNPWELLTKVRNFISEQSGDLKNKKNKLTALDEYFRISRYTNEDKVWTSGYSIGFRDINNYSNYNFAAVLSKIVYKPKRAKNDIGVKKGEFIRFITNETNHHDDNYSVLTEKEKQDIYLSFHDELPWNLEKTCELEEEYIPLVTDFRLTRPDHTEPCGETFYVNEEEIFINPKASLYRYYQLCPHCGYIVNIPKENLSEGIKKRIEKRCSEDPNLFRKKYLYSELFSLEKKSPQKRKTLINNDTKVQ